MGTISNTELAAGCDEVPATASRKTELAPDEYPVRLAATLIPYIEGGCDVAGALNDAYLRFLRMTKCIIRNNLAEGYAFLSLGSTASRDQLLETTMRDGLHEVMLFPTKELTKVRGMSCRCPFDKPQWMPRPAYDEAVRSAYDKSFAERIGDTVVYHEWSALTDLVRSAIRLAIAPVNPETLFGAAVTREMSQHLTEALVAIHARDIAYALIGRQNCRAARGYAILAEHTSVAIPIGQPVDSARSNSWLVVTE